MTGTNGHAVTYVYDADGQRVKKVEDGQTTVYIGNLYEKNLSTGVVTTYYYAGAQRLAQRQGDVVSYFTGDHLGSTSLTTNSSGVEIGRQKYYPYGAPRGQSGTLKTDYRFTGQRSEEAKFGSLYDYGARFYSPVLGRFISPDTIVPEPDNPQALNRYSYVGGNPLRYTDPSGHFSEEELLDTYGAFLGPKQLHSMRDQPETAYWYYLLRAAELGDSVKFWGVEQGNVTGQITAQDGKLWIAGSDGGKYSIGWEGIGGAGSGINAQASQLTKANGVAFHT